MLEPMRDLSIAPCIFGNIEMTTRGARERNSKKTTLMQSLSLNVYAELKILVRFCTGGR